MSDSDVRWHAVKAPAQRSHSEIELRSPNGKAVGKAIFSGADVKLSVGGEHAAAFNAFLEAELPALMERFFSQERAGVNSVTGSRPCHLTRVAKRWKGWRPRPKPDGLGATNTEVASGKKKGPRNSVSEALLVRLATTRIPLPRITVKSLLAGDWTPFW